MDPNTLDIQANAPNLLKIELDYETACSAVNRLRACAESCAESSRQMTSVSSSLPGALTGEAAALLNENLIGWSAEIKGIGGRVERLATLIKKTADAIKAADEASAATSSGDPFGGGAGGGGFR